MDWEQSHTYKGRADSKPGLKYISRHWINAGVKRKRSEPEPIDCQCTITEAPLCDQLKKMLGIEPFYYKALPITSMETDGESANNFPMDISQENKNSKHEESMEVSEGPTVSDHELEMLEDSAYSEQRRFQWDQ